MIGGRPIQGHFITRRVEDSLSISRAIQDRRAEKAWNRKRFHNFVSSSLSCSQLSHLPVTSRGLPQTFADDALKRMPLTLQSLYYPLSCLSCPTPLSKSPKLIPSARFFLAPSARFRPPPHSHPVTFRSLKVVATMYLSSDAQACKAIRGAITKFIGA